jgi:hypothetical protein
MSVYWLWKGFVFSYYEMNGSIKNIGRFLATTKVMVSIKSVQQNQILCQQNNEVECRSEFSQMSSASTAGSPRLTTYETMDALER